MGLDEFPDFSTGGAGFGLSGYTALFDNVIDQTFPQGVLVSVYPVIRHSLIMLSSLAMAFRTAVGYR